MRQRITGRRMGGVYLSALAVLLLFFVPRVARAEAEVEGFFLGLGLHTDNLGAEDRKEGSPPGSVYIDEDGGGLDLQLGWAFTESFLLRLRLSVAEHDTDKDNIDFYSGSGVFEAAYLFRLGRPLRPYVMGGLGGFFMSAEEGDAYSYETTGSGAVIGGGLVYFFNDHFALDTCLRLSFINWANKTAETKLPDGTTFRVETPIEEEGEGGNLMIGLSYYF
ncbi:MAG: outer membrane beta-barrel protein [Candidatus Eisenbacteria bacterium]|nr:outer membrane beta-barrel protein [Candidatus Eisenbacteria bacterium]